MYYSLRIFSLGDTIEIEHSDILFSFLSLYRFVMIAVCDLVASLT